jgi:hypothetical protein
MASSALRDARHLLSWPVVVLAILLMGAAGPAAVAQVSQPGPGEAKIRLELKNPTTMDFTETPLQDAVDYLKELHNIEIQLDVKALGDAGIVADVAVTHQLKGISLDSALKLLLHDLELTTVVTNEMLLITTPAAASRMIEVRIYDVGDFISAAGDTEKLAQVLVTLLSPSDEPKASGPPARKSSLIEIVAFQNLLLVRASIPDHDELTRILPEIRDKLKAAK